MTELKRALGLPGLMFYGLGMILGAGIYSVLGVAAGRAGDALWQSFLLASLVAALTALSYAELATTYSKAGAEYVYLERALPKWPSLSVATGLLVVVSGAATAATVAMSFAGYLSGFIDVPQALSAWVLLALALGINVLGIKEATWLNIAFTLIEAGGLVLFIVIGTTSDTFGEALAAKPALPVVAVSALVFFSFLGFENIANLAEEAKEPARDLPRAIFLSLVIATLLYVLVAIAIVALIPPDRLADSTAPLTAAAQAQSPNGARILNVVALFATANTALVAILVASRLLYGMAKGGSLPAALSRMLPGRKTPWIALLLVFGMAAALVPIGKLDVVASLSSFASLLAFAAVNAALIALRFSHPNDERPFRVPLAIGRVPVPAALGLVSTLALATQLEAQSLAIGGSVLVATFLLHAAQQRFGAARATT